LDVNGHWFFGGEWAGCKGNADFGMRNADCGLRRVESGEWRVERGGRIGILAETREAEKGGG